MAWLVFVTIFYKDISSYKIFHIQFREEIRHRNQFVVHATLDLVEELQWVSPGMYSLYFVN